MAVTEFHYENINSRDDLISNLRTALVTNLGWTESASTTSKTTEMLIKSPDEISSGMNLIAHIHTYNDSGNDGVALHIYRPDDDAFTGSNSFDNPDADPPSCFGDSTRDLSDNSGALAGYQTSYISYYPLYLDVYGDTNGFVFVTRPMQEDATNDWGFFYAWGYNSLIESQDYPVAYVGFGRSSSYGLVRETFLYGRYLSHRNGSNAVKNSGNNYARLGFYFGAYSGNTIEYHSYTNTISGVNISRWIYPFVAYRVTSGIKEIVTYPNLMVGHYELNYGDIVDTGTAQYKVIWKKCNNCGYGRILIKITTTPDEPL